MTYAQAEQLRIASNGKPCKHLEIDVLYYGEEENSYLRSGQLACKACGDILNDMEKDDYLYHDEMTLLRDACFQLAESCIDWKEEQKTIDIVSDEFIEVSKLTHQFYGIAFHRFQSYGEIDVMIIIRAIHLISKLLSVQGADRLLKCFDGVLEVLVEIATFSGGSSNSKDPRFLFLNDLAPAIEAYKKLK